MTNTPLETSNLSDRERGSKVSHRSIRRLGRDTLFYGVAAVLSRITGFVMLPVYTRYLTPSDYGLLAILELSMEVVLLLFSAGAAAGVMRFYFKATTKQGRNEVLFTAWLTVVGLYMAGTVTLVMLAPAIHTLVLGNAGTVGMVRLAAINFTVSSLFVVPFIALAVDQRPIASSIALTAKLLLQVSLNILFIVILGWGPKGMLWSTFCSATAVGVVMAAALLRRTGTAWSWQSFKDLRRFSIPIQLSSAGTFFLTYADRFFLEKSHGLAAVGIYGIAYQFGFLISFMLGAPFFQAWNPQRFQLAHEERSRRDSIYNRGFLYGDVIVVGGAVGISLFIQPIIAVMTTARFHSASALVPILVLGYVFQVWTFVVDFGIEVSEKTRYTSMATWLSVVVSAILYLLLIPPFGAMGAAVATLISMLCRFGATLYFAQRVWPISYRWGPHIRMLMGGIFVTTAAFLTPVSELPARAAVACVGFAVYAIWVWLAVLHREERAALIRLARSPRSFSSIARGA